MTIRLRSHHLLCALTFAGKGYTPAFIENFEAIVRRLEIGRETVEIVEGPDDVCAPLSNDPACHCHNESVRLRDRQAAEALSSLLQLPLHSGAALLLTPDRLQAMRAAFASGSIRQACSSCQWKPLCDSIAQDGFRQSWLVRLDEESPSGHAPAPQPA